MQQQPKKQETMNTATRKLEMQMALDELVAMTYELTQLQKTAAPLIHNYYKELLAAGFSESDALSIVRVHGWLPKCQ
ncbi:hypothetical protein ACFSVM_25475 [Paenibacillus shunpengii]|uniref:Uncharacterized protein n=1 Tax=Paenibacillus shunpengii TaxID=2054424 RepID=A0ABW5SX94_9BACL